jgi:Inner membrane component of T3SS, cytoplasmic domain
MYQLIIENGFREGEHIRPEGNELTIGRDPHCMLRLVEDGVSQSHCVLRITRRGVIVRDAGSTNGIFVNDQQVEEVRLASGDLLEVGVVRLRFEFLHGSPGDKRRVNPLFWISVLAVALAFGVEFGAVGIGFYMRSHHFTQAEMDAIVHWFPPVSQDQLPEVLLPPPAPAEKPPAK